ncbi:MAG: hypothetical protein WCD79_00605 [Chthoniobacteraceae bacterium]
MKKPTPLFTRLLFLVVAAILIPLLALLWFFPAGSHPATLDVTFKLTDLDYHPLPHVPVRVVFGSDPDWRSPDAGYRLETDDNGQARFTARVMIDKRRRKGNFSFLGNLFSLGELTDHLMAGAELGYANHHWLYNVDMDHFANGDVLQDDFSVYTPDISRRFSDKAKETENGWAMKDFGGMMLSGPGYEPWDFRLDVDPNDSTKWTLQFAFKKSPEPVQC